MNPQDDPGTVFIEARPDATPPPSALDLDRVKRDGYRQRRRRRAVLGGTATAGVGAVAAVLALSVVGLPGTDVPADEQGYPGGQGFEFDPEQAGYPDSVDWDVRQPALDEDAWEIFGDLAVDAGFLEAEALDSELPSEEEITSMMDEQDLSYYGALSELGFQDDPLRFGPWTSPAAGGQVYLRGYVARDGDEEAERSSFTITALQPGGWTAEPGPSGDAFPQHLISDEASWTDEAPEFSSEELDDGRTLMVADHGCALEAAVVYPNGSALRSSWDLHCEGQGRDMTVEDLSTAMLAMPQIEYDTSELQPIDELVEFPPGWPYDEAWETTADADAQESIAAATDELDSAHPGVELLASSAAQLDFQTGTVQRTYAADYYMPFDDTRGNPVHFTVRYFLPGGWVPGAAPEGSNAEIYLIECGGPRDDKDDVCEETEINGRTVATRTWGIGDNQSLSVVVFDPDGWAVAFETSFEGPIDGYALEGIVGLADTLPAPVYDAEEYERGE